MKPGIHKRLYTVLSPSSTTTGVRVRPYYTSSSPPIPVPAPPSRLPSRIPTEPKHNVHAALSLSVDQDIPTIPAQLYAQQYQPKFNAPSNPSTFSCTSSPRKSARIHFQLDVGAYGIPKRCHHQRSFQTFIPDDSNLAVSIGEDAYFIRDNAMGVADGVGGWARVSSSHYNPPESVHSSPSALFARHLMHYTSAELSSPPVSHKSLHDIHDFDPASELESHLSELSEGIDVLQILERAYERTVNAHVQPQHIGSPPLHAGSSTALVAVLDHVHAPPNDRGSVSVTASDAHDPIRHRASRISPPVESNTDPEVKLESPTSPVPVVKIAHIGDCMGMLVRGEEIVWRSEEMWWAFNTPVQLAPPRPSSTPPIPPPTLSSLLSSTSLLFFPPRSPSPQARLGSNPHSPSPPPPPLITPRTTAHLITLPVHANDILILASDGLSDNLWDEDILDEIVQFRRKWVSSGTGTGVGSETRSETQQAEWERAAGLTLETSTSSASPASPTMPPPRPTPTTDALRQHSLATMLSEALCSRARSVSERRASLGSRKLTPNACAQGLDAYVEVEGEGVGARRRESRTGLSAEEDEVPFARRAREAGKMFRGGKRDDITVLVAVISPAPTPTPLNPN